MRTSGSPAAGGPGVFLWPTNRNARATATACRGTTPTPAKYVLPRPRSPPSPAVTDRILLFTGKGGTGKTTCAAATGLKAARQGTRTLVLSSDPAHSLSDAFDRELGPEPVEVAPNLDAQEVDLYYSMQKPWGHMRELMLTVFRWQGVEQVAAEELAALPVLRAPHLGEEVFGLDLLEKVGDALYGDDASGPGEHRNPAARLHQAQTYRVEEIEGDGGAGGYRVALHLPFAEVADVDARQYDDELVVQVAGQRRHYVLPTFLSYYTLQDHRLREDGWLEVRFARSTKGRG